MSKAKRYVVGALASTAAVIAALVVVAYVNRNSSVAPARTLNPSEQNLAVFDAASRLIEQHFFDQEVLKTQAWKDYSAAWREKAREVAPGLLYLNALNNFGLGMTSSHVTFEPPTPSAASTAPATPAAPPAGTINVAEVMDMVTSGPGLDAIYFRRGGRTHYIVGDLRKHSPAERAGISPGWVLLETTWNATQTGVRFSASVLPLDEAGVRAADTTGFPPTVTSAEELAEYARTHARQFEFAAEKLPARPVFDERKYGDVTYIRFDGFDATGGAGQAMDAIDGAGPAGLILDLRSNRGGKELELWRVLGRLLGHGEVVGFTIERSGYRMPMKSLKLGGHYQGPVVLLIGPATASAAEIAAAAVQDHKRGKLIGRRTNGSVVSARRFDLPDGGNIMIPVRDFIRVDKRRIEDVGVEPDIWMLPTLEDVRQGRDPLVDRALASLKADTRTARSP